MEKFFDIIYKILGWTNFILPITLIALYFYAGPTYKLKIIITILLIISLIITALVNITEHIIKKINKKIKISITDINRKEKK